MKIDPAFVGALQYLRQYPSDNDKGKRREIWKNIRAKYQLCDGVKYKVELSTGELRVKCGTPAPTERDFIVFVWRTDAEDLHTCLLYHNEDRPTYIPQNALALSGRL